MHSIEETKRAISAKLDRAIEPHAYMECRLQSDYCGTAAKRTGCADAWEIIQAKSKIAAKKPFI